MGVVYMYSFYFFLQSEDQYSRPTMGSLAPAAFVIPAVLLGVPLLIIILVAIRAWVQKDPPKVPRQTKKYRSPEPEPAVFEGRDKSSEIRMA